MNLKTKFHHVLQPHRSRCTVAVSVPSKQDLLTMMNTLFVDCENTGFAGTLGIAKTHPKDNYNHKVGRETALKNSSAVYYHLMTVERCKSGTLFKFMIHNLEKTVSLLEVNFLVQAGKDVVHIQFINTVRIKRV